VSTTGPVGRDRVMVTTPATPPADVLPIRTEQAMCDKRADAGTGWDYSFVCFRPAEHEGDRHFDSVDKAEWWFA
jgi:hypothetical protein